jgi:hypothetical protein
MNNQIEEEVNRTVNKLEVCTGCGRIRNRFYTDYITCCPDNQYMLLQTYVDNSALSVKKVWKQFLKKSTKQQNNEKFLDSIKATDSI